MGTLEEIVVVGALAVLCLACVSPALGPGRGLLRQGWRIGSAATLAILFTMVFRWDLVGVWLRPAPLVVVAAASAIGLRRNRETLARAYRSGGPIRRVGAGLLALGLPLAALAALTSVPRSAAPPSDALRLAAPFEEGKFFVAQGGSRAIYNHHYGVRAQRHALDLTEIGPLGRRASGLFPDALSDYHIYGRRVVAGCRGTVVALQSGFDDAPPGELDEAVPPAGNFVATRCGDAFVVYAHLATDILVSLDQAVEFGTPIGTIANSGRTTEPHLHIHAVRCCPTNMHELMFDGDGLPILIDGQLLSRNDVVRGGL